jgi:hypothetical protein
MKKEKYTCVMIVMTVMNIQFIYPLHFPKLFQHRRKNELRSYMIVEKA